MKFLPEIMPAHPMAPEGFPSRRNEAPRRWSGLMSERRVRRQAGASRKLTQICI